MSSFPDADAIIAAYEDQLEALAEVFRRRAQLSTDPSSRFNGLSPQQIQDRLEQPRSVTLMPE